MNKTKKQSTALMAIATLSILIASACQIERVSADQAKTAAKKPVAKKKQKVRPEFAPPEVNPALPNVLLIGDSISMGYMLAARETLSGEANVYRPATNCGPTSRGLEQLESWLGDTKWDVIHFNFGLHDLKYMGASGNLTDPKAEASHQQIPPDQYEANLTKIAQRLKKTGAKLIWRETTPVPEGSAGRIAGDSVRYNTIAAKVMNSVGGIQTDPMFGFATENASMQLPANVHYTKPGSQKLGQHVAQVIRETLDSK